MSASHDPKHQISPEAGNGRYPVQSCKRSKSLHYQETPGGTLHERSPSKMYPRLPLPCQRPVPLLPLPIRQAPHPSDPRQGAAPSQPVLPAMATQESLGVIPPLRPGAHSLRPSQHTSVHGRARLSVKQGPALSYSTSPIETRPGTIVQLQEWADEQYHVKSEIKHEQVNTRLGQIYGPSEMINPRIRRDMVKGPARSYQHMLTSNHIAARSQYV